MANRIDFDATGPKSEEMTVRDCWRSYLDLVVPKDAGPSQIQGTRDAFYAGFLCCLSVVKRIGEPDITEDAGLAILERLMEEEMRYLDQLKRRTGYDR